MHSCGLMDNMRCEFSELHGSHGMLYILLLVFTLSNYSLFSLAIAYTIGAWSGQVAKSLRSLRLPLV